MQHLLSLSLLQLVLLLRRSLRSNTGSVTLTDGSLQQSTDLGLKVVDCMNAISSAGNAGAAASLDLMAPGDDVRWENFDHL